MVRFVRSIGVGAASCFALLLAPLESAAQLVFEPPSELLECLTSTRPEAVLPVYPGGVLAGTNAVVRVNLRFKSAGSAPLADVRFNSGGDPFAVSVRDYVASYRLPCLPAGTEFAGTQEFQFVVKDGAGRALKSSARTANGEGNFSDECMAVIKNLPPPSFPGTGLTGVYPKSGKVIVRLKFTSATEPPAAEILYDSGERRLANAVLGSVSAYRMPCMQPGDGPLLAQQVFGFQFDGEAISALKSQFMLTEFLGAVADLKSERVRFDFSTMGCPFQVQFTLYQPYAHNGVRQIGAPLADRREFIEWLRNIRLAIPPAAMRSVIGSETKVSVPCAVLDLS